MSHNLFDLSKLADIDHELASLRQKLRRKYRSVDEHLLDESIEDALLYHLRCPECFDASRGVPLPYYLELRARSYLDMRLRKEKRHRKHEKSAGVSDKFFEKIVSEVRAERCIYIGRDRSEQEAEEREEEERGILDAIVTHLNSRDRAGVQLLRVGASFKKWVQRLRIEHLPLEEQRQKVNAEKDRLKKKLRRRAQKMQGGGARPRVRMRFRATCFDADGECESWLTQLRMPYSKQVDCSKAGKHSSASYLPSSVFFW